MVELRKRPAPKEVVPPPPAKRGSGAGAKVKKLADKAKAAVVGTGSTDSGPATEPAMEPATAAAGAESTAAPAMEATPASEQVGATGYVLCMHLCFAPWIVCDAM